MKASDTAPAWLPVYCVTMCPMWESDLCWNDIFYDGGSRCASMRWWIFGSVGVSSCQCWKTEIWILYVCSSDGLLRYLDIWILFQTAILKEPKISFSTEGRVYLFRVWRAAAWFFYMPTLRRWGSFGLWRYPKQEKEPASVILARKSDKLMTTYEYLGRIVDSEAILIIQWAT